MWICDFVVRWDGRAAEEVGALFAAVCEVVDRPALSVVRLRDGLAHVRVGGTLRSYSDMERLGEAFRASGLYAGGFVCAMPPVVP